ncbi:hypothetical protein [Streptomyces sp. NPDC091371]|uniref:hypothetical protein n=1 Tax=Streptomyces sp. NPDC091371 TaxID=3155303 RepID=UPI003432A386
METAQQAHTPAGKPTTPRSAGRTARNSLFWALLIPTVTSAAGFLGQFPYGGLWAGVLVILATAAVGATVAGAKWHRSGAATIVGFGVFALSLFAGPALYEAYAKEFGERVGAVVVLTGERSGTKGDGEYYCHVIDDAGEVSELGNQQNCFGDFAEEQHVVLYKDPLGVLAPWIEATDDRSVDPIGPGITAGLFLLVGGSMLTAGLRRRSDRDLLEEQRRRHDPPWHSPS